MNNYFNHDINVKFADGILSHSQDWNWFIQYIQANFDLCDVSSWDELKHNRRNLVDIYNRFIKIQNVSNINEDCIESDLIRDIKIVAMFYLGQVTDERCKINIKSQFGKLLYVIVVVTKLLSIDNDDYAYTFDERLFKCRNMWQLLNVDALRLHQEELLNELSCLTIVGWDEGAKCFEDNINMILFPCRSEFIEKNKEKFFNVDAFSYVELNEVPFSWEEEYLGNMINVSFNNGEVQPAIVLGNNTYPNISLWSIGTLNLMKDYFSNDISTFVIDTIGYMLHKSLPDRRTILSHCRLLTCAINSLEIHQLLSCSSFVFMGRIFQNKEVIRTINKTVEVVNLIKMIQSLNDPAVIVRIRDNGFPTSKIQNRILDGYMEKKIRRIECIVNSTEFLQYLSDFEIAKAINSDYLGLVMQVFRKQISENKGIIIANLFCEYMIFLLHVNSHNLYVDRSIVQSEIITIQTLWADKYYEFEIGSLYTFSYETTILREDVKKHNELIINNPLAVAYNTMAVAELDMCSIMENASEHPMMFLVSPIEINPIYPKKAKLNYEHHVVDNYLKMIVERIKLEKGYRFLNVLDTDLYMKAIHYRYSLNLSTCMNLFIESTTLFEIVQNYSPFRLIPIEEEEPTQIANLTQLFPILEMAIRDLAKLTGHMPFKKNLEAFMTYRDPSSILRDIIEDVFNETKSFENIPDIIFVYHHMYNSNSSNIRNEAIHGRDYLSGSRLNLAYKTTLVSIHMILKRIEIIKNNRN